MTRKDYPLIAAALAASRPIDLSYHADEAWRQWQFTVDYMAVALYADNTAFDGPRFIKACNTLPFLTRDGSGNSTGEPQ